MDPNETNACWYGYRVGYSRGRQDGLPWVREIVERRRQQAREGSDPCGVAACNDILAGLHKIEAGASQQGHDGTVKVPVDEHTREIGVLI